MVTRLACIVLMAAAVMTGCDDDEDVNIPIEDETTTTTVAETTTSTADGTTTSATGGGNASPPVSLQDPVNDHGTIALEGQTVPIELDDFYFEPTYVTASEGRTVTARLHNEGDVAHTFTIEALNIDEVLEPGQEREVSVDLPDEGPARYICRFHAAQGMKGAFAVS